MSLDTATTLDHVRAIMRDDDALNHITPSDLRLMMEEIDRLRKALWDIACNSMFSSKDAVCEYARKVAEINQPI